MAGSQQKKPILFYGLIIFLAVAILGTIADFALGKDGLVAIISVVAAFLILAAFIAIEVISRKAAEKRAKNESFAGEYDVPAEQRFIRHTNDSKSMPQFQPADGFDEFDGNGFGDGFDSTYSDDFGDSGNEENSAAESPSAILRRRAAQLYASRGGEAEAEYSGEQSAFDDASVIDDTAPSQDDGQGEYENEYDAEQPEDYAEQPEEYAEQTEDFAEQPEEADAFRPVRSYGYAPVNENPAAQNPAPAQPAQAAVSRQTVKSVPVQPDVPVSGQTLESFYEGMSEEDILYRDCVEVWAADAKPSVLRLIKYVEGIEDKKTQALFGRDLEYVNAMLDRIYCFTQLEYVDELLDLQKYNFASLVKECLKRFSPFFMEKRLGLLWKGLDVDVVTDRRWFVFALTQVIFNSVEFTPENGKIAISAKQNGEFIDLMIDDSGKGIAPDELPCAFIAGYMGDDAPNEAGRRTGMGLFIAQSVLRKMGGDAFIESNYGKGTRVTLRVPANTK